MAKKENIAETATTEEVKTEAVVDSSAKKTDKKQKVKKAKVATTAKKGKLKETMGELKKVTWPTFGKTMKQTGMVLSVILLFGVVVLGIDVFVSWIIKLLTSF